MPRRKSKLEWFQAELAALRQSIPEELRLPSLRDNRLEGFASLFVIVLPLLASAVTLYLPNLCSTSSFALSTTASAVA